MSASMWYSIKVLSLFFHKLINIYICCSNFDLDTSTGISSESFSHVHAHTFLHLDGRNSCRPPEGFVGGQGRLQGGPVPL